MAEMRSNVWRITLEVEDAAELDRLMEYVADSDNGWPLVEKAETMQRAVELHFLTTGKRIPLPHGRHADVVKVVSVEPPEDEDEFLTPRKFSNLVLGERAAIAERTGWPADGYAAAEFLLSAAEYLWKSRPIGTPDKTWEFLRDLAFQLEGVSAFEMEDLDYQMTYKWAERDRLHMLTRASI